MSTSSKPSPSPLFKKSPSDSEYEPIPLRITHHYLLEQIVLLLRQLLRVFRHLETEIGIPLHHKMRWDALALLQSEGSRRQGYLNVTKML
jgi:hypothetical protein